MNKRLRRVFSLSRSDVVVIQCEAGNNNRRLTLVSGGDNVNLHTTDWDKHNGKLFEDKLALLINELTLFNNFLSSILDTNDLESNRYNVRRWLNDDDSPSCGAIVLYYGNSVFHANERLGFIEISDCHSSIRVYIHPSKTEINKSIRLNKIIIKKLLWFKDSIKDYPLYTVL